MPKQPRANPPETDDVARLNALADWWPVMTITQCGTAFAKIEVYEG